ncbi:MAG: glycosyltransferase family 4 protein [Limisphaerales bacterium]
MSAKKKIRIMHVVFSLDPGGMENGVVNVANRLPEDEFEVYFCCLEKGGAFVERLNHPENVIVLDRNKPGFSYRTTLRVMWAVFKLWPDIVHTHNIGPMTYGVYGTLFGRLRPVLQGEHGVFQDDLEQPHRLAQRKRQYNRCHTIHTVCESLKDYIVDLGFDGSKIVSVRNGVDTDRFQPTDRQAVRKELGLPPDGPWMGIVGRFDVNKKHLLLIKAFNVIAKEYPTAQLLVLGDKGNEKENIHAAAKASPVADRIHLVGFQSNPLPYYQSLDLLTAPSPFEGLSNAVLESMSCGVPALAHTACGNTEVIDSGVNGYLAEMDTPEQLIDQLRKVLGQPDQLAEVGRECRRRAEAKHSIPKMIENYAELYRRVAGVHNGAASG